MFNVMQSLNKEAFMLILSNIWDKWASKEILIKCAKRAKRVGITASGLSVNLFQQDKFDCAENCFQQEPSTPSIFIF